MSKYTSPPHVQMHHTVCLYVVDTATFQRLCATRGPIDDFTVHKSTTRESSKPDAVPDTNAPTGAEAWRFIPRRIRDAPHAKHHAGTSVHPTRTRLNAIDECATRRIDRRVRLNTRDASRVFERTDDGWPTLSRNLFFFSRRHRAASIGASRDRES
jgi:hypothetical protein